MLTFRCEDVNPFTLTLIPQNNFDLTVIDYLEEMIRDTVYLTGVKYVCPDGDLVISGHNGAPEVIERFVNGVKIFE